MSTGRSVRVCSRSHTLRDIDTPTICSVLVLTSSICLPTVSSSTSIGHGALTHRMSACKPEGFLSHRACRSWPASREVMLRLRSEAHFSMRSTSTVAFNFAVEGLLPFAHHFRCSPGCLPYIFFTTGRSAAGHPPIDTHTICLSLLTSFGHGALMCACTPEGSGRLAWGLARPPCVRPS